ncbi:MAG: HPr family phosphocarrier protein [Gemmataceae bacterium]|nr:HPr family phosphocarrier protein [Gemmataceae bacterium]
MSEESLKRTVVVANPNGLHLRPSAAFVQTAQRFQSRVTVHHNGNSVDGKNSPLDLMLLMAMPGSELVLEAEGPDASQMLDALAEVLSHVPAEA